MFGNSNLEHCQWVRCPSGVYRGYHTPVEWEQHKQYVKVDLPPPILPLQYENPEPATPEQIAKEMSQAVSRLQTKLGAHQGEFER